MTAMERMDIASRTCLRSEIAADKEFLFLVFASTREMEMSLVDWSAPQKEAFLRQQFLAQYQHYHRHYGDADFRIIEQEGRPAGRLCVDRQGGGIRIVDIALLPEFRGKGLGTQLLEDMLEEGTVAGLAVTIHVEKHNPARRLYQRLGFEPIEDNGVHWLMEWNPRRISHEPI
jgi:ribosomal protein S18 acetylase RimI-like enzyme